MILLLMLVILCNVYLCTSFLCFGKQIVTRCTAMHRHKLAMLAAAKADTNAKNVFALKTGMLSTCT